MGSVGGWRGSCGHACHGYPCSCNVLSLICTITRTCTQQNVPRQCPLHVVLVYCSQWPHSLPWDGLRHHTMLHGSMHMEAYGRILVLTFHRQFGSTMQQMFWPIQCKPSPSPCVHSCSYITSWRLATFSNTHCCRQIQTNFLRQRLRGEEIS